MAANPKRETPIPKKMKSLPATIRRRLISGRPQNEMQRHMYVDRGYRELANRERHEPEDPISASPQTVRNYPHGHRLLRRPVRADVLCSSSLPQMRIPHPDAMAWQQSEIAL
jgi:hypothetical protein